MSNTDDWAVVAKANRKSKSGQEQGGKKKVNLNSLPKLERAQPVEESPTQFDAFIKKKPDLVKDKSKVETAKRAQQTSKNKEDKKPTVHMKDAINQLKLHDFENVVAKDKAAFPGNPSIWLKDVASLLNLSLECVIDEGPLFEGKPVGYPLCHMTRSVRKLIVSVIKGCEPETIHLFVEFCITSTINDITKNLPTFGYRVLLQLLAVEKPSLIMETFAQNLDLIRHNQNRPQRCLVIMWAMGQVGINSIADGLTVWRDLMLPLITIRSLSTYCIDYLQLLFDTHPTANGVYSVLDYQSFFPILDMIWSPVTHLPTKQHKKLLELYPKIKTLAYGKSPSSLRNFFPSYLVRLSEAENKNHRAELLDCLIDCLHRDKLCYSVWRQMYTKHLEQSSILLKHIVQNYQTLKPKLESKLLRETVSAFSITNEEIKRTASRNDNNGYKQCVQSCKAILGEMSRPGLPWLQILFAIFVLLAAVFTVDVYTSKDAHNCRIVAALHHYGVYTFMSHLWSRLVLYSNKSMTWLQENIPYYYARTSAIVSPYIHMMWLKLYDCGVYLTEATKPHRDWLNKKVPEMLQYIQTKFPWVQEQCRYYGSIIYNYTVIYSLWMWQYITHYCNIIAVWLQENVFIGEMSPDKLQQHATSALTALQQYIHAGYTWCAQLITN